MSEPLTATAVERLDAALARVRDPSLEGTKVFTRLYEASAHREAEAADARAAAQSSFGPLDGRIVSIKGLFDVAGEPTSSGSAVLRTLAAAKADAPVVQRLRAAGAVIIGKTQMTEFAFSALGTNLHDPVPGNPHDRARVPGGSSSGAVVSVIDAMAEIAIGSDTGGSIRIPAALSGAVGFKPTSGRVPTTGAFSLSSSLDTIGPIARTVHDCAAADAILAGLEPVPLHPRSPTRLIVARGRLFEGIEAPIMAAFEDAVAALREAGMTIEDGTIDPSLDALADIDRIGGFPSIELGATLRILGVERLDAVDPKTRVRIEAGAGVLATNYVRMSRLRRAAILAFEASLAEDDAYLLPTTPIEAPLIAALADDATFHRANGLMLRNPRVANLLDCPSISLPIWPQGGRLPAGLMMIGRRGADRRLLAMAASVEAALKTDAPTFDADRR